MKVTYENEWERSAVHIDMMIPYEEDYQIRMIGDNELSCLLKISGSGREGQSRYTIYTDGAVSMEKMYSRREMNKEEIEQFLEQLMEAVDEVKRYLLDPDHILLTPQFIFLKDGRYRFCYLPVKDPEGVKPLCISFHELTEYFVKKLDYQDTEGVFLVYRLHKETLSESYELKKIIEEYRSEKEQRSKEQKKETGIPDTAVFLMEDEKKTSPVGMVHEDPPQYHPLKKAVQKIKSGRWGRWEDLITEIDGQERGGHL